MKENFSYLTKDLESMLFARNYYNWIISKFSGYIGKEILEIGSGIGNFTEYILSQNIESVTAIEPSVNLYPILSEKYLSNPMVETFNGHLSDYIPTSHRDFDSILYVNVLEHVKEDSKEVQLATDCLTANGYLLVVVPALPFLYSALDHTFGHYRRYSKSRLVETIESAGLRIIKHDYMDFIGVFPWLVCYRILKMKNLSVQSVKVYDRFIIPFCRRLESLLPVPIGKNLFLIAQKIN